jgi:hypothetical protein
MDTTFTAQPPNPPTPPNPDYEAVLVRLTKLETQRLWLLGIACMALAFGLAGLLINRPRPEPGPSAPIKSEQVKAKEFILESSNGRRGVWGTPKSNPALLMWDSFGGQVAISAENGETTLLLSRQKSAPNPSAILSTYADGKVGLSFSDSNNKTRLEMKLSHVGPSLTFFDKRGRKGMILAGTDDSSMLILLDKQGRRRAVLGVTDLGPLIGLYDEHGKLTWGRSSGP